MRQPLVYRRIPKVLQPTVDKPAGNSVASISRVLRAVEEVGTLHRKFLEKNDSVERAHKEMQTKHEELKKLHQAYVKKASEIELLPEQLKREILAMGNHLRSMKVGETGPRGEKGDRGEKGETGERGESGERGTDGKHGKDGIDTSPDDVIETLKKKKLKMEHIDGLSKEIVNINNRISTYGMHYGSTTMARGGGDTIKAGTNISLTRNSDGSTTITSSASGFSRLDATGTVDGNNAAFTFTSKPSYIVSDGVFYREDKGWTWAAGSPGTATMTVAPFSDVYGIA